MLRALILVLAMLASGAQAQEFRLLMLDQPLCEWCEQWDAEVGVVYARTVEGQAAPLLRQDIGAPLPAGVTIDRPARYTPTFILLDAGGAEVGRIEGYPGEDFFYGLLQQLLARAAASTSGEG